MDVEFIADAEIPEGIEAVGKAFGYGLLTSEGTNAVIVTTTHSGYLDSVAQNGDAIDPVWHNHFVKLGPVAQCLGISANSTGMIEITFDEGGDVEINDTEAELTKVPRGIVNGTEVLTSTFPFEIWPGNVVQNAVSFNLVPVFEGDNLQTVCVNDISTFHCGSESKHDWRKHDWRKHDWRKHDWRKHDWRKHDWRKHDWRKHDWRKHDWRKHDWRKHTGGNMTGGNMTGGNMTGAKHDWRKHDWSKHDWSKHDWCPK